MFLSYKTSEQKENKILLFKIFGDFAIFVIGVKKKIWDIFLQIRSFKAPSYLEHLKHPLNLAVS